MIAFMQTIKDSPDQTPPLQANTQTELPTVMPIAGALTPESVVSPSVQQAAVPATPTTNNKNGLSIFSIIGIILVIGAVGAAGYYFGTRQTQETTTPTLQNEDATEPVMTPLPITEVQPETTQSPSTRVTSAVNTSKFVSSLLGASFEYPPSLGPAKESLASQGKAGTASPAEDWRRVGFNMQGFEVGYTEISSASNGYSPSEWEGRPHWIKGTILLSDTENQVAELLKKNGLEVLKVEKISSSNHDVVFQAYTLNCHGECTMARFYIVPKNTTEYSNISVLTVLKYYPMTGEEDTQPGGSEAYMQRVRTEAASDIPLIEAGSSAANTNTAANGQNVILNSLEFM